MRRSLAAVRFSLAPRLPGFLHQAVAQSQGRGGGKYLILGLSTSELLMYMYVHVITDNNKITNNNNKLTNMESYASFKKLMELINHIIVEIQTANLSLRYVCHELYIRKLKEEKNFKKCICPPFKFMAGRLIDLQGCQVLIKYKKKS